MAEVRLILSTVDDAEAAQAIADGLVADRLAACVTILPGATSVYRWQGSVEAAEERLLLIKTTAEREAACLATLEELHPYDVPEALSLEVSAGLPAYLAWVAETVGREEG
ncbi:MAG: divalent-cation tolerance protein CutA [Nitrospirae bacterium]|nr:MAG: divalent-cation tolerance protein CutA [Nitrospirota bacterium]